MNLWNFETKKTKQTNKQTKNKKLWSHNAKKPRNRETKMPRHQDPAYPLSIPTPTHAPDHPPGGHARTCGTRALLGNRGTYSTCCDLHEFGLLPFMLQSHKLRVQVCMMLDIILRAVSQHSRQTARACFGDVACSQGSSSSLAGLPETLQMFETRLVSGSWILLK